LNLNIELYFIRHGESYGNIGVPVSGVHPDDPRLTDIGLKQANAVAMRFMNTDISAIYTSALMRACQTMQPTAENHGIEMRVLRELMEVGTHIPNTDPEVCKSLAPNAYNDLCRMDLEPVRFATEDDTAEVCAARAAYSMNTVFENCKDGDRVLICTHGGFIGYLLRYCLGISLPEHFNWQIDNGSVFGIRFYKDRIPKLICANEISHLK
jgi:broad specificity phosphatase PhoE